MDGALINSREMHEDFNPAWCGLQPVHVEWRAGSHADVGRAARGAWRAKDIGQTDLIAALRSVANGEGLPATATGAEDPFGLSRQERAILLHVARGNPNAEIAQAMYLAPNTVKTYWQAALAKLGARNRADAIMRANEAGLL